MPLSLSDMIYTPGTWSDCHNYRRHSGLLTGACIDFCSVSIVVLAHSGTSTSPQCVNAVALVGHSSNDCVLWPIHLFLLCYHCSNSLSLPPTVCHGENPLCYSDLFVWYPTDPNGVQFHSRWSDLFWGWFASHCYPFKALIYYAKNIASQCGKAINAPLLTVILEILNDNNALAW